MQGTHRDVQRERAGSAEAEEDREGALDSEQSFVIDSPDDLTDLAARNRLSLVHHYLRRLTEAIVGSRRDVYAKKRSGT